MSSPPSGERYLHSIPKCVCGWKECGDYQKFFWDHPVWAGVIELTFVKSDPESKALKKALDRTLQVPPSKQRQWTLSSQQQFLSATTMNDDSWSKVSCSPQDDDDKSSSPSKDCVWVAHYNVACHHWIQPHVRKYKTDRERYSFLQPFSAKETTNFLCQVDSQESFPNSLGQQENDRMYLLERSLVPEFFVRQLFQRLERSLHWKKSRAKRSEEPQNDDLWGAWTTDKFYHLCSASKLCNAVADHSSKNIGIQIQSYHCTQEEKDEGQQLLSHTHPPPPIPKCVCGSPKCHSYQKLFRNHPTWGGVVQFEFVGHAQESRALKATMDRLFRVCAKDQRCWWQVVTQSTTTTLESLQQETNNSLLSAVENSETAALLLRDGTNPPPPPRRRRDNNILVAQYHVACHHWAQSQIQNYKDSPENHPFFVPFFVNETFGDPVDQNETFQDVSSSTVVENNQEEGKLLLCWRSPMMHELTVAEEAIKTRFNKMKTEERVHRQRTIPPVSNSELESQISKDKKLSSVPGKQSAEKTASTLLREAELETTTVWETVQDMTVESLASWNLVVDQNGEDVISLPQQQQQQQQPRGSNQLEGDKIDQMIATGEKSVPAKTQDKQWRSQQQPNCCNDSFVVASAHCELKTTTKVLLEKKEIENNILKDQLAELLGTLSQLHDKVNSLLRAKVYGISKGYRKRVTAPRKNHSRDTRTTAAVCGRSSVPSKTSLNSEDESTEDSGVDISELKQTVCCLYADALGRGTYSGSISMSSGMPHGIGRMEYEKQGSCCLLLYEGNWNHVGWTGHGRLSTAKNDEYLGHFEMGRQHGRGVTKFSDGRVFDGRYNRGHMLHGKMTYTDGSQYEGDWLDGTYHGFGEIVFPNHSRYQGEFRNGEMCGYGKMTWCNGVEYKGVWGDTSSSTIHYEGQDERVKTWVSSQWAYFTKSHK